MFKWLNKQGVASDEGFVVQVIDRFHVEYREAENALTLEVDIGFVGGRVPLCYFKKECYSTMGWRAFFIKFF